jgi:DNA-binding protein H-NS
MARQKTKTFAELKVEIAALEAQAAKLHVAEKKEVIERIKEAIGIYGITATDLGLARAAKGAPKTKGVKRASSKAAKNSKTAKTAKYKDDTGNVWSGRGPRPQWLRKALEGGASLEQFAVGA